jgi:Na+-transporting methylmalonyl-CoA/oxaloacetate decarboxylase gamma subunit
MIFWADDNTNHGVFHLNFHLENSNFLALVDANGKTIIDSISLRNQKPDVTYGRKVDGESDWAYLEKSTPNSTNFTGYIEPAAEKFVKVDPSGFGMAMVAMTVVFLSLILLYVVFKGIARAFSHEWKKRSLMKQGKMVEAEALPSETSGEINAAIVMALHLYMSQLHDHEQTVLTIKKISRTYSPWSSKIYGLRRSPR